MPAGKNQKETKYVDYKIERKETEEESDQTELASWFSILTLSYIEVPRPP